MVQSKSNHWHACFWTGAQVPSVHEANKPGSATPPGAITSEWLLKPESLRVGRYDDWREAKRWLDAVVAGSPASLSAEELLRQRVHKAPQMLACSMDVDLLYESVTGGHVAVALVRCPRYAAPCPDYEKPGPRM